MPAAITPSEVRLLHTAVGETPAWVGRVVKATSAIQRWPAQLVALAFHWASFAYSAYAATKAAHKAGIVSPGLGFSDSPACAARASLFYSISCAMMGVDFLYFFVMMRDKELTSVWAAPTKQILRAAHKTLTEAPVMLLARLVLNWVPILVWLRDALGTFAPAFCLAFAATIGQNTMNALTFNFWAAHNGLSQSAFTARLVTGELTYEQAVSDFARVNSERKAVARGLRAARLTMIFYMLSMAVILYDFEIRPWAGLPFAIIYACNVISFVLMLEPFLALHDWPDELCAALMESTELAWGPSERTNFVALVSTTKVKITLWDFEMSPAFRTALPLVFFGWWLYFRRFSDRAAMGFPFDVACGVNHSSHIVCTASGCIYG